MIKKDIDLENVEQQATASIEKLKVSAGTIRRIVALVVQGIISIAGVYRDWETQEERVAKLVSEIALLQKEGAVQDSIVDVNYNTARKIQKEVENFYYDMITKRMSAEAAKEQAPLS